MLGNNLSAYLKLSTRVITFSGILSVFLSLIQHRVHAQTAISGRKVSPADQLIFSEPTNLTNNPQDPAYAQVAENSKCKI